MFFLSVNSSYLITKFFHHFIVTFTIVTVLSWFSQSIKIIEIISQSDKALSYFLKMSFFIIPYLWYLTIPITVIIAAIITANQIFNTKEILIMESIGINRVTINKILLIISSTIMLFHLAISSYFMSYSYKKFKDIQWYITSNHGISLIKDKVFNSQITGITIFIQQKGKNSLFHGIFIDDQRDETKRVTLTAEIGELKQDNSGNLLLSLKNGSYQEYNNLYNPMVYFESYQLILPINSQNKLIKQDIHSQSLISLMKGQNNKMLAYGHQRIVWPLYSIIFLGITLMIFYLEKMKYKSLVTMLTTFLLGGASFLLQSLAVKSSYYIFLMYFLPILLLLIIMICLLCFRLQYR